MRVLRNMLRFAPAAAVLALAAMQSARADVTDSMTPRIARALNRSPGGCLSGSYRPPPRPTDGSVILSGMANVPHAAPDAGSQLRGSSSGPTSIGVASSAENGFRGMHHLGLGSR